MPVFLCVKSESNRLATYIRVVQAGREQRVALYVDLIKMGGQLTSFLCIYQQCFFFDDIYLLAGINLFCHTRAPMWILGDL